jgi:predicted nucleotidyltransferase
VVDLRIEARAREGDFIETLDGLIFDVKGLLHPPDRVIAYLRYVPDGRGRRERAGIKYRKVYSLYSRAKLLAKRWPQYVCRDRFFNREVQAVPVDKVKQHYLPTEKFAQLRRAVELDERERLANDMAETLVKEARTPASKIGVSGSILVGLHTAKSDLDLLLYGSNVSRKCHSKLRALLDTCSQGFSPYTKSDLRRLYAQRDLRAALSFETFAKHERLKVLQGKFMGTDYFIRCVKEWDEWPEAYGDRKYLQVGRATVRATISDDSESIFTPCTYELADAKVTGKHPAPAQIVSFRGRFCEQARAGESVLAKGTLERVEDERGVTHRLVIGEDPLDCLVVVGKRE